MASEASLAEQTTDEQVEGNKVIDDAKSDKENNVSQLEEAGESEIEKSKAEEQANSETPATNSKEKMENKDEASAAEAVKKEDEHDMTSASEISEGKKDDEPTADEVKKENKDSEASGSEVLGNNMGGTSDAPAVVEVKKEDEDPGACGSEVLRGNEGDEFDAPAVDEVKKENKDPEACGSEGFGDNKDDASDTAAVDVVKKEIEDSEASYSEVFGDNKGDASGAPAVDEVTKENKDFEASVSDVSADTKGDASDAPAVDEVKRENEDTKACRSEFLGDKTVDNVKMENEDTEASGSEVLGDKKGDAFGAPVVDEIKKEVDSEASGSEVLGDNKGNTSVAEVVKEEAETSSPFDAEVDASVKEGDEKSLITTEPLSEEAENLQVDPSLTSVEDSEQVGYEPEASEAVVETAKTIDESSGISVNAGLASEAMTKSEEQLLASAVTEPAPDSVEEPDGKNKISAVDEVVEASKDDNITAIEVEAALEPLKVESVLETGSSASHTLDTVPGDSAEVVTKDTGSHSVSVANDDVNSGGESELPATENSGEEVTVDTSLPNPPITVGGETEVIDSTPVTEAIEIVVKPDTSTEEQEGEKTAKTELNEEQKEEKILEEELVKEQEEEKAVEAGSTITITKETGDQIGHENEVTEAYSVEGKASEGAYKVVEEKKDMDVSSSAAVSSEKGKASEVFEKFAETVKDDTAVAQTSRDIDLAKQTNETSTSVKEPAAKLEETEASDIGTVEKDEIDEKKDTSEKDDAQNLVECSKDGAESKTNVEEAEKSDVGNEKKVETEEKKDEAEKSDAQNVVESSKDSADSKADREVQKTEASGKPSKTLMSKVKHSIVKVKKAIIGKSPSSKAIPSESKDEVKVK